MDVLAARVGPSVPRHERPARDGARVASIETGLAAAAAKLSHQVSYLHSYTTADISDHFAQTKNDVSKGGTTKNQEEEEKHQKEGAGNRGAPENLSGQ